MAPTRRSPSLCWPRLLILPAAPAQGGPGRGPCSAGTPARNMVNRTDTRLSHEFPPDHSDDPEVRVLGDRVKWKAELGSRAYAQPVVAGDRVLIGTNNENPRNPRDRGRADRGRTRTARPSTRASSCASGRPTANSSGRWSTTSWRAGR